MVTDQRWRFLIAACSIIIFVVLFVALLFASRRQTVALFISKALKRVRTSAKAEKILLDSIIHVHLFWLKARYMSLPNGPSHWQRWWICQWRVSLTGRPWRFQHYMGQPDGPLGLANVTSCSVGSRSVTLSLYPVLSVEFIIHYWVGGSDSEIVFVCNFSSFLDTGDPGCPKI